MHPGTRTASSPESIIIPAVIIAAVGVVTRCIERGRAIVVRTTWCGCAPVLVRWWHRCAIIRATWRWWRYSTVNIRWIITRWWTSVCLWRWWWRYRSLMIIVTRWWRSVWHRWRIVIKRPVRCLPVIIGRLFWHPVMVWAVVCLCCKCTRAKNSGNHSSRKLFNTHYSLYPR